MNSVTIAKKLMDCYPEIQRERIRQQEEDGFWEGTSTLVKRMSFCILRKISKTMPSSQSRQASRSTSHRNFKIVESTDMNLPRKPRCHLNFDKLSIFQLKILRRDSVMMLFQLLRQDVLEMCDGVEKRPTVKDILTKFDFPEGTLHKNVLKVSK